MKIRNDTDSDSYKFGVHLAMGETVTLPTELEQSKVDYLVRAYTVVPDEPEAVDATEPEPIEAVTITAGPNWPADEPVPEVPIVEQEPRPKPAKKRGKRKGYRRS